jgi:hypothetical protein
VPQFVELSCDKALNSFIPESCSGTTPEQSLPTLPIRVIAAAIPVSLARRFTASKVIQAEKMIAG